IHPTRNTHTPPPPHTHLPPLKTCHNLLAAFQDGLSICLALTSHTPHHTTHTRTHHTHNKQCWFSWHFGKDRCYLKLNYLFGSIMTFSLCSATLCVFSAFHLHFGV